jgi:hypothetical protein
MTTAAVEPMHGDNRPDPDERIRTTVRALRSAYEIDTAVLARHLGISRQSLYNRLNGHAPWLAAEVATLAQFFECEIQDFYTGTVNLGRPLTGGGSPGGPTPRRRNSRRTQVTPDTIGTTSVTARFPSPPMCPRPGLSLVPAAASMNRQLPPCYGSTITGRDDQGLTRFEYDGSPRVVECGHGVDYAHAA